MLNPTNAVILIVEDDPDQMDLLASYAVEEVKTLMADISFESKLRQKLKDIRIMKVVNIAALEKAVSTDARVLLALLDCNVPDSSSAPAHDQLVKTKYRITGQHKAVDIVSSVLPNTPITMISSLNRFQKIVSQYYDNKHDLSINFISKNDPMTIKRNIAYYLRQYLRSQA